MQSNKHWIIAALCLFAWMGIWKFIVFPFLVEFFELNNPLGLYNLINILGLVAGGIFGGYISKAIKAKQEQKQEN
ncbi:hypothetical protein [Flavobacterium beibuense]|uniref:Uncharacterized protein n=1 Tax=Flavobacterium beibuense TaxID=657326 RepID=A0A444W760_9FLAO|nr:hypothetical protein [Flavobacterium beibuense]RYJ41719.1 hypothetical protein NU09_2644 [Flavobacterium beibuense]